MVVPAGSARWLALALAAALAAGSADAGAQQRAASRQLRVTGRVLDATSGEAVHSARVWLMVGGTEQARIVWSGITDEDGAWASTLLDLVPMDLHVEAFGYRSAAGPVEGMDGSETSVRVELVPAPLDMEPLVVVSSRRSRLDASGFNERRRQGHGFSITREEFESRHPTRASDIFRLLPGVTVQPGQGGQTGTLRYRGCSPDLVLDGVPLVGATAVDDILSPLDIEAVEVHSGVLYPSRGMGSACGTVMVWTREGNRDEMGHPMTWRRAGVIAAFVALTILLTR